MALKLRLSRIFLIDGLTGLTFHFVTVANNELRVNRPIELPV